MISHLNIKFSDASSWQQYKYLLTVSTQVCTVSEPETEGTVAILYFSFIMMPLVSDFVKARNVLLKTIMKDFKTTIGKRVELQIAESSLIS